MDNKTSFYNIGNEIVNPTRSILKFVCKAMRDKNYDPVNQLIGYILSGDPTYITSFNDARKLISGTDRDTLLEEIIRTYINGLENEEL